MNPSIIQAVFDELTPLPWEIRDYEEYIKSDDFCSVGATFYSLLKRQNRLQNTPVFFQQKMKRIYSDALYKNIFIKNQTQQILNEFEKQGIEVIPLKGPLFAEKYFGDIGARVSSDVDLLIRKRDLIRAKRFLKKLGYVYEKNELPSYFNCGFYKTIPGSPCPLAVELHWDLANEKTSKVDIEEFWNHAERYQSTYHYVKELSDHHAFYMICLHGWRHNLESLKYYLDIIQMIKMLQLTLDYSRLIEGGKLDQTKKRLIRTLSIVYEEFPFLRHIKSFPYHKSNKLNTYQATNHTSLKKYAAFMDYQFLSYDSIFHRFYEVKQWFFPSQQEIAAQSGKPNKTYLLMDYLVLYKKRLGNLWKALG
jgi:hypothetical protein